jgi:hypothetical protein
MQVSEIRGGVQQEDIQDYAQILQACEEGDIHTVQTLLIVEPRQMLLSTYTWVITDTHIRL